jgi:hypothetical protein
MSSIFDEVERAEESAGRGIETPEKPARRAARAPVDEDAAVAEDAGLTREELAELRARNARLWPLGQ